MRKGALELCVLSIVATSDEAYPPDIQKKLEELGLNVVEGTLYPLLTRLKNGGILTYTWQESRQGPPRKYYRLTDEGQQFLVELKVAWRDFIDLVEKVVV